MPGGLSRLIAGFMPPGIPGVHCRHIYPVKRALITRLRSRCLLVDPSFLDLSRCMGILAAALVTGQASAQGIALMYFERPPYLVSTVNGGVSGLAADPSVAAMREAGVSFTWHKFSARRIVELVKEDSIAACGVGWFRTPEREGVAKFSRAVYRDKPMIALTPKKWSLPANSSLEQVLADKNTRVLVKDGFSYGKLGPMLAKYKPHLINTAADVAQMVQMIKANRADMTFLAEEEATYMLEQAGFRAQDFNLVRFPGMPEGETRHFMCSKKVPDSVMQKLDAAIHFE